MFVLGTIELVLLLLVAAVTWLFYRIVSVRHKAQNSNACAEDLAAAFEEVKQQLATARIENENELKKKELELQQLAELLAKFNEPVIVTTPSEETTDV